MSEIWKIAKPLSHEERKALADRVSVAFRTPEAREELERSASLGIAQPRNQYDDFVKRAEYARWWQSIKDIPFTNYTY